MEPQRVSWKIEKGVNQALQKGCRGNNRHPHGGNLWVHSAQKTGRKETRAVGRFRRVKERINGVNRRKGGVKRENIGESAELQRGVKKKKGGGGGKSKELVKDWSLVRGELFN